MAKTRVEAELSQLPVAERIDFVLLQRGGEKLYVKDS